MDDIFISINTDTISSVLQAYGIFEPVTKICELLRINYPKEDPLSKEIRLIIRLDFKEQTSLVVKFINEKEHLQSLIEEQSIFSEHLRKRGMAIAKRYISSGHYCLPYKFNDITLAVTLEDFMDGELSQITEDNIYRIGAMLAKAHTISEQDDCHVNGKTLFNVLTRNDLYSYEAFINLERHFTGNLSVIYKNIQQLYLQKMTKLQKLNEYKMYAIQGDISENNLFIAENGEIGMFDFNNCGDNYLLSDAVLEGMFMSRLMDYTEPVNDEISSRLFITFIRAYNDVRPFSDTELELIPDIYAVTNAFWSSQIIYDDNSLTNLIKRENKRVVITMMEKIYSQLCEVIPVRSWLA